MNVVYTINIENSAFKFPPVNDNTHLADPIDIALWFKQYTCLTEISADIAP